MKHGIGNRLYKAIHPFVSICIHENRTNGYNTKLRYKLHLVMFVSPEVSALNQVQFLCSCYGMTEDDQSSPRSLASPSTISGIRSISLGFWGAHPNNLRARIELPRELDPQAYFPTERISVV